MTLTDGLIGLLLVALVLRQLRGRPLTVRSLVLPAAVVAWAATDYLPSVPTGGNDLALVAVTVITGAALGIGTARLTRLHHAPDGTLIAKATAAAAVLWVGGIASRFLFGLFVQHGGAGAIDTFDQAHHLTGFDAWAAALILMSIAEVASRSLTLLVRSRLTPLPRAAPSDGMTPVIRGHEPTLASTTTVTRSW
jgi:hypothetical protein